LGLDEDMQTKFADCEFSIRTKEEHISVCKAMEVAELKTHFSWVYGVNHDSILNELQYFHVIGGLTPDIMHDLLEGVIPIVMCDFILYCIKSKFFSLDELNYVIQNFNYSSSEVVDKPSIISMAHLKNRSLRQSASQKWLLFVLLPMFIGYRIPVGNKNWRCLRFLMKITRLVFSPYLLESDLFHLGDLIERFLDCYKLCYGKRLTAKMHHLIHYPRWIRLVGPLWALWCMRFEAKHAYFKNVLRSTKNFINLPFTLGYRHQQWMAQKTSSVYGRTFFKEEIRGSKAVSFSLKLVPYGTQVAEHFQIDYPFPLVKQLSWLRVNSITYKVDQSVVICSLRGCRPGQFGLLANIICYKGKFIFVFQMMTTKGFSLHYQAYKVLSRDFFLITELKDVCDSPVYALHQPSFRRPNSDYCMYVVTKTEVFNKLLLPTC